MLFQKAIQKKSELIIFMLAMVAVLNFKTAVTLSTDKEIIINYTHRINYLKL